MKIEMKTIFVVVIIPGLCLILTVMIISLPERGEKKSVRELTEAQAAGQAQSKWPIFRGWQSLPGTEELVCGELSAKD